MIFGVTMSGGAHIILPKFTPPDTLKAISEYKVNRVVLVPVMIQICLSSPSAEQFDLSSLEKVIYGGSPMPTSILELALKHFPNARFMQGYGRFAYLIDELKLSYAKG